MLTKKLNKKINSKQKTSADFPTQAAIPTTYSYGPVETTDGQTVINLGFAVDLTNKANFQLTVGGQEMSEGASYDYQFTSVASNNTSSQVTLNAPVIAGLNIRARYFGILQPVQSSTSITSLQAQVNSLYAPKNYLLNSAFDLWQRGTSTNIANGSSTYQADRWYVKNSLGTNGVITYSRTTGVVAGSKYGASVQISTAPTAAQANGTELYQVVENPTAIELYGQSACLSAYIKALGNVTQVGLQFCYATSEVKPSSFIGSEVLVSVNSSSFVLGQIVNQALGTSMTTSGVIGVRIRITGVSSGNLYDLNNGFVVEQVMMNAGTQAASFSRAGRTFQQELANCLRYFRTYSLIEMPAFVYTTNQASGILWFDVQMRTAPSLSGASVSDSNNFSSAVFSNNTNSTKNARINCTTSGLASNTCGNWFFNGSFDAEI